MKIYLAGPMRGIPEFNFPAFYHAAKVLREKGHEVFSPAERDNAAHGADISKNNPTGDEALATLTHGFSLREALAADFEYICLHADAIVLLPGWQQSKGACAEKAAGEALGLKIYFSDALGVDSFERGEMTGEDG